MSNDTLVLRYPWIFGLLGVRNPGFTVPLNLWNSGFTVPLGLRALRILGCPKPQKRNPKLGWCCLWSRVHAWAHHTTRAHRI